MTPATPHHYPAYRPSGVEWLGGVAGVELPKFAGSPSSGRIEAPTEGRRL